MDLGPLRILSVLVVFAVFGMAVLTFLDVVGRYFFNSPIPGTFEIVGLILGVGAIGAFPLVTLSGNHITVDLFDRYIRGRVRRIRRIVVGVGTALMAAFMAERLFAAALDEWESDFVTENLGISRAPLLIFLALVCAATAVLMVTVRPDSRNSGDDRVC